MSEILGHDVNERPLRAGDRVVPLKAVHVEARLEGMPPWPWTVAGESKSHSGFLIIEERDNLGVERCANPQVLRRIDDRTDHQPSEYTFGSLMDHLKSGVPA